MSLETTATHINGAEAKQALKNSAAKGLERIKQELFIRIDKIKYLNLGAAFPRFKAEYAVVVTAYPSDIPVPEAEFIIAINTPEVTKAELQEHFSEIEVIEAKRERLLKGVELCDNILDLVRPVGMVEETLSAGNIPDELRIAQGLKIPMIKTEGGRRSEVYVSAEELKV